MKKLKIEGKKSKKSVFKKIKNTEKSKLSREFYLGTSIGFFFASLSHFEAAKNEFLHSSFTLQFNMILFVIFLCIAFFLLGVYLGKKDEYTSLKEPE